MADVHSKSFFGQKTGIIIKSPSKEEDYFFMTCIRKKADGSWEKPSQGEGKTIKFSLEEMVMILQLLSKESKSWTTLHSFKEEKTSISFKWDDTKEGQLYINLGDYKKALHTPQIVIFRMLMKHMLAEKIEYATGPKQSEYTESLIKNPNKTENIATLVVSEQIIEGRAESDSPKIKMNSKMVNKKNKSSNKTTKLQGKITGTSEKALLLMFGNNTEVWIPRSSVHSNYDATNQDLQEFTIENWILEKNNIHG